MFSLVIPRPVFDSPPREAAPPRSSLDESDDEARREMDRLSLSSPAQMTMSRDESGERARREMDRLSLSSESRPTADPWDELADLSLTFLAR